MPTEDNAQDNPASSSRGAKDSTALSPRAAQEVNKLRALPRLPGLRFWATWALVFLGIVGLNTDFAVHAFAAPITLLGLANVILGFSLVVGTTLIWFAVFERLRRGVFGSNRTLWITFERSRVSGTSLKKAIHDDGASELVMLSGAKDESHRGLRNQGIIAALIAFLCASLVAFAVAYSHEFMQFRPLFFLAALTTAFALIAGWVFLRTWRHLHGPTAEDIKSAVALHCECEETRRKELRDLHKRGI